MVHASLWWPNSQKACWFLELSTCRISWYGKTSGMGKKETPAQKSRQRTCIPCPQVYWQGWKAEVQRLVGFEGEWVGALVDWSTDYFLFGLNANIVFTSTWINTLVFWCLVSIWSACLYKLYFVFFRYTTIFEPLPGIILLFSENDWLIYGSLWWNIKLACRPYLHKCPQQRKHSSLLIFLTFGQKPICSQYVTGFGGAWTLKYPKPSEALYPGKYKILWHFPLWVLNTKTV